MIRGFVSFEVNDYFELSGFSKLIITLNKQKEVSS